MAEVRPYRPSLCSVCSKSSICQQTQTALAWFSLEVRTRSQCSPILCPICHSSGEGGSPNLTSNPGSLHPTGSVGGSSLQGGELRLPYEAPVGGAGVEGPAGWPGPNRPFSGPIWPFSGPRPSMGDPSHPVYGRSDRGLTITHSFTESGGPFNTPQGGVFGYYKSFI